MTDRSPAELLRAAAARARQLDQAATPGPWDEPFHDRNPGDEGWWVFNGQKGSAEHAVLVAVDYNLCAKADARYVAAFRAVAAPLADLLQVLSWFPSQSDPTDLIAAVAVARALLGEEAEQE